MSNPTGPVYLDPETIKSLNNYREKLLSLPYNNRASRLVDAITALLEMEGRDDD